MKKFCVFLLFVLSLPVSAEIVSSVSFNPSRLGNYTHLKISGEANFRGGLEVQGTDPSSADPLQRGILVINNRADGVTMSNETGQDYNIPRVSGNYLMNAPQPSTLGAGNAKLMMKDTKFLPHSLTGMGNYSVTDADPALSGTFTVEVKGGDLNVSSDSFIQTINGNDFLLQWANSTKIGNELSIAGSPDSRPLAQQGNGLGEAIGFRLAGNDIPSFHSVDFVE
ncbi:MAG: hypothetical protein IKO35_04490, partial [Elusimicrobiaceae bacterium]|nr:hypothetical protein [Elusimicrobiaceae bacterium]